MSLVQAGWDAKEAQLQTNLGAALSRIAGHEAAAAAAGHERTIAQQAADAASKDINTHAASAAELQSWCNELSSQVSDLTKAAAAKAKAYAELQAVVERLTGEAAAERRRAEQLEMQVGTCRQT